MTLLDVHRRATGLSTMKTSDLTGLALDWAVAKCEVDRRIAEGEHHKQWWLKHLDEGFARTHYSTDWLWSGPIIEREGIATMQESTGGWVSWWSGGHRSEENSQYGDTPLIAAMRCYVTSKLGDEVEIPEELA